MSQVAFDMEQGPRENLEDAVRAFSVAGHDPQKQTMTVLLVCDGVGGNRYGEVASCRAGELISANLAASAALKLTSEGTGAVTPECVLSALQDAIARAGRAIWRQAEMNADLRGMATTVVCAVLLDHLLYVGWAGDSRCYLYSRNGLQQITQDHSETQELVDLGIITADEVRNHPAAHTITRYLGCPRSCEAETRIVRIRPGDIVLLCTDGLTDVLADTEIADDLAAHSRARLDFDVLPARLAARALEAGTQDNVTVLCCEYQPAFATAPADPNRTQTAGYPAALADTFHQLTKELSHDRTH